MHSQAEKNIKVHVYQNYTDTREGKENIRCDFRMRLKIILSWVGNENVCLMQQIKCAHSFSTSTKDVFNTYGT